MLQRWNTLRGLCLLAFWFARTDAAQAVEIRLGEPVAKFFNRYCIDCHTGDSPEAGVSLEKLVNSHDLLTHTETLERVFNVVTHGEMPPTDGEQPSLDERDEFLHGLNGVLDDIDRLSPPDPGRVTMRRLNRIEYTNTVKDLFGVDFNPSSHFPSDEIAHGFDNNGDQLKLSPLLMERYLLAAEQIAEKVFPITQNVEPVPSQDLEFQPDIDEKILADTHTLTNSPEKKDPPEWVRRSFGPGNYLIRFAASATAPPDATVKLAVVAMGDQLNEGLSKPESIKQLVNLGDGPCRILETITVKSRDITVPDDIVIRVSKIAGADRIGVALLQNSAPVSLHVAKVAVEGPWSNSLTPWQLKIRPPYGRSNEEHQRIILKDLLPRVYRRAVTDDEIQRLCDLAAWAEKSGADLDEQWRMVFQAMLVSPKFLFRVELDSDPNSPHIEKLDDYQLASRLSYFLWNTTPDEQLLALAKEGKLSEQLDQQVDRMLADPRSITLAENFATQWLHLRLLDGASPSTRQFPTWNGGLKRSLLKETQLFVYAMLTENRNVIDMLGTDFTFLDQNLAKHYGIEDTNGNRTGVPPIAEPGKPIRGNDFKRVTFKSPNEGGLLRHGSILTITSHPTRTSPVKRGHWVLEQLLGAAPPPPPPDVPDLKVRGRSDPKDLREALERHRADPGCAGCHARMDPIGFAFENYDPIGRLRTGNDKVLDLSGTLPGGKTFNGPDELIDLLKGRRDQFVTCLTEKLLTYALGRGLERSDRPTIHRIVKTMKQHDDQFVVLVKEVIRSDQFRSRRGQSL